MAHTASSGDAPAVDPAHITQAARDTLNVRRVFGDSYERDGTLVIPVATVWGGTGSGWGAGSGEMSGKGAAGLPHLPRRGDAPEGGPGEPGSGNADGNAGGEGSGGGGGFGVRVKATGVYVVDAQGVRWQPAVDVNRVVLGGQALLAVVGVAASLAWAIGRLRR
ncbi:hypothetical protein [Cellulosimicrobium marinum]|uniref:hypothetical protein n=1 Tax=Cellulosimicrobium marinum TaxID=1638992 RepID=UPI001E3F2367|nr:hypothetical protein [Cellulosimicrobium marinum]MCB7137812.1 hypothetical protein [Cellulosimicrobium marinum]